MCDPNPLLVSLTHFVDHPDQLAEHTMNSVDWEAIEVLMPQILRGKSKDDVQQLLLAEIDGMSKKRLLAVLAGETLEESSSSEEEEEEDVVPAPVEVEMQIEEVQHSEEVEETVEKEEGELDDVKTATPIPSDPRSPTPNESSDDGEKDGGRDDVEDGEIDTDEEIDRQIEKDLEELFD